jgi:predicted RNase H-like HicB family nuclease
MCNYKAVIHHEDDQYWAEFPAFPGCYTSGTTLEEVRGNLSKVLRFHIQGLNSVDIDASDLAEVAEVAV